MSKKTNMQKQKEPQEEMDLIQKEQSFSLYDLLNVSKNATETEIKKSYRILALKFHPDKNQGDEKAREMFQKVNEAHKILINPEKRKVYDLTGEVDDMNIEQFHQAYDYYRALFPKIKKQDIIDFEQRYRFGPMEEEDLTQFYLTYQGDMRPLLQCIPLSLNSDIDRFIHYFEGQIQTRKLKANKLFKQTKEHIILLKDESKEAEAEIQNLEQLAQSIVAKRQLSFQQTMQNLEDTYATKKQQQKMKDTMKDIDEKEFQIKKKIKQQK